MEVDEIQRQVCKFQRVSSNASTTTTDNSSNPQKIATNRGNLELQNHVDGGGGAGAGGGGIDIVVGGGGVGRLCGWPSSRIVRVSRASGGKDRHSKVLTSKGLRDRRVRLSVSTAIQFYDLQDRLGYDQPSKAVEWLLKAASSSIDELPSLDPSFPGAIAHHHHHHNHHQVAEEKKSTGNNNDFEDPNYQQQQNSNNNNVSQAKSPACSSTSETSKGSGLSLSRTENRIKARERAREMVSKKVKEKGGDSTTAAVLNQVNSISENSSFTDLLTGGINSATTVRRPSPDSRTHWATPMDYFFTRPPQPSPQLIQIPQFNITAGDNHSHHNHHHNHHQNNPQHHFSFLQDSFAPAVTTTGGGEGLNFAMTSSSSGGAAVAPGFSRGTLQSNLPSSIMTHHHHLQRFQSSSIDGSTSTNLPFFIVPNTASDHFPATGSYHLSYGGGGDGGGRHSDHHKEKTKN